MSLFFVSSKADIFAGMMLDCFFPALYANRHETGPGLRVIIPAQADGTAVVDGGKSTS